MADLCARSSKAVDDSLVARHVRCPSEPPSERGADLEVAQEERPLVEPPSPHPAGDLVVALARVAGAAGRHDVVERVSATTGHSEYAIALHRAVGCAAVRAPTPSRLERIPLLVAEVVLRALHPASAAAGGSGPATPVDTHAAAGIPRRRRGA